MRVSPKFIIFLIVFVNQLGYGILFPLLSLYEQKMQVGPFAIAGAMGMYAVAQFFAAPILGILSDRHGRRPLLLFSLLGSTIAFIMFAFAGNIWVLFLARLIDGLSGGNIPIAQAYMADITSSEKRTESMGLILGGMSLGFVAGPILGGVLGVGGLALPSLVAAGISFVNFVLAFFFLKETEKEDVRQRAIKLLPFKEIIRAVRIETVGVMLVILFVLQLTWSLHFPIFSIFLEKNFMIGTLGAGLLMAYRGGISALVQLFLVGKMAGRNPPAFLKIAIIVMVSGLFLTGVAPTFAILFLGLTIMEFGGDFISPIVMGEISKKTDSSEQGEIMGVAGSMSSLGRMMGPYIGGASFEALGASSPFYLGAILMGAGVLFLR